MDKQEFAAWMKVTKSSETNWVVDCCQFLNHGAYLFYKGGTDNRVYLDIQPDGSATIGVYRYAIPCITDAEFTPKHVNKVALNAREALEHVAGKLNLSCLLDVANDVEALATSMRQQPVQQALI